MLRQFPKFIHNSINGMFAPVQQNQVHIRKLFHFLSHMSLQSDATVSIVGYKSNVLRIGIDCPDHADVRRDVVFVQKTAAYLVLQTVFIKIGRFRHPVCQIFPVVRQKHHVPAGQCAHYRHFSCHRVIQRQIRRPRLLSEQNDQRRFLASPIFIQNILHHSLPAGKV